MALTDDQADSAVQKSIHEAGGFQPPHHDTKTLLEAGLVVNDQRQQYRRRVVSNVRQFDHDIDLIAIPAEAGTTVSESRTAVKKNAKPR